MTGPVDEGVASDARADACVHCGQAVRSTAAFCPSCGAPVQASSPALVSTVASGAPKSAGTVRRSLGVPALAAAVVVAVLVVGLGLLGAFLISRGHASSPSAKKAGARQATSGKPATGTPGPAKTASQPAQQAGMDPVSSFHALDEAYQKILFDDEAIKALVVRYNGGVDGSADARERLVADCETMLAAVEGRAADVRALSVSEGSRTEEQARLMELCDLNVNRVQVIRQSAEIAVGLSDPRAQREAYLAPIRAAYKPGTGKSRYALDFEAKKYAAAPHFPE